MSVPDQKDARSAPGVELEALRRFLCEHVETLDELAVMAALRSRREDGAVELEVLVRATELPPQAVDEALARLTSAGLVSRAGDAVRAFTHGERDGEFERLLELAIAEYRRNPLQLMAFMTTNAIERVRGAARRTFGESLRAGEPKK